MRACCINYLHFFIYLKFTSFSSVFFAELYRSGLLRRSTTSSASIVSFLPFLPANGTEQRSCCIQWQDETRETRWDVQLFRKSTAQDESGESMRKQLLFLEFSNLKFAWRTATFSRYHQLQQCHWSVQVVVNSMCPAAGHDAERLFGSV